MQPLQLTLTGFKGIRDGLGRAELHLDLEALAGDAELIAITGANGSGKTTVIDNLTPYCLLASRGTSAGAGGFSYYDHVYLPESIKDLVWAHEGRSYRSQIVVRLNGRRRTEAFLHRLDDDGRWRPVVLAQGTRSDGRLETYTACVESICGTAETFFTSVFAAQGRRPLSSYRNAEIKGLLAELLGQDAILAMGAQASETARLVKSGLGSLRQERAAVEQEAELVRAGLQRLDGAEQRQGAAEEALRGARMALDVAVAAQAQFAAEQAQHQAAAQQRARLLAERQAVQGEGERAAQALASQDAAAARRLERLQQRVRERAALAVQRRETLQRARVPCVRTLAQAADVERAARRLPLARRVHAQRCAATQARREQVAELREAPSALQLVDQRLAALEREAGKAVLQVQDLVRRSGLVADVPCAGTDLQGRCMLLGDARAAQSLMPSAQAVVDRCAHERVEALHQRAAALRRIHSFTQAAQALATAERREGRAADRVAYLRDRVAQQAACVQARATLAQIDTELAVLPPAGAAPTWNAEEQAERADLVRERRAMAAHAAQSQARSAAALARCDAALSALPPVAGAGRLSAAEAAVARARIQQEAAQQALVAAARDRQAADDLRTRQAHLAHRLAASAAHVERVERALGDWTLLARCLGHDGLIALAIDDVGPTLSALTNDLLLASHGPRFTVALQTQCATVKGELREGFDIVVHDGLVGEAKSLALMSGGEKCWIDACVVRAVALYLVRHTGRCYTTLFSDEADGALDPERKRMFMAMKRAVLRLGGYAREFFVTQTPELVAMADAVIDLDRLKNAESATALHAC
jgi:exonuclease SbcC